MAKNRILYLCKDYSDKDDGGKIYDYKLSSAIVNNKVDLTVFFVKNKKSFNFPTWKYKIDKQEIKRIIEISKEYDFIIISHEHLSSLTKYIKPDLFIFHNVLSIFKSPNILLNLYFRLFSKKLEKKIINSSKNILVLSKREQLYLKNKYPKSFLCEPPGLKDLSLPAIVDLGKIKLPGSNAWMPKKLSKLSSVDIKLLSLSYKIEFNENFESNLALIEDNFLAGFKLKLIEMLYNGDVIFSRVDLKQEIKGLGLMDDLFFKINSISEIENIKLPDIDLIMKVCRHNQNILKNNFTWDKIAERIINNI